MCDFAVNGCSCCIDPCFKRRRRSNVNIFVISLESAFIGITVEPIQF